MSQDIQERIAALPQDPQERMEAMARYHEELLLNMAVDVRPRMRTTFAFLREQDRRRRSERSSREMHQDRHESAETSDVQTPSQRSRDSAVRGLPTAAAIQTHATGTGAAFQASGTGLGATAQQVPSFSSLNVPSSPGSPQLVPIPDNVTPRWTAPGMHSFDTTYFYCLDAPFTPSAAPSGGATPGRPIRLTMAEANAQDLHTRFGKYTDCNIVDVRIPPSEDVDAPLKWFRHELSTKTERDLLIFYYYGVANDTNKDYYWRFDGHKSIFNAYDIFELCGKSGLALMFLLDCHAHDSYETSAKLPPPAGHVSIIARGNQLFNESGEVVRNQGGFTKCLTSSLSKAARDTGKTINEPRTIPQLLRSADHKLTWKLRRIDPEIFKQQANRPVMNIVIDQQDIRQNKDKDPQAGYGKIRFYLRTTIKRSSNTKETPGAVAMPSAVAMPAPMPGYAQPSTPAEGVVASAAQACAVCPACGRRTSNAVSAIDEGYHEGASLDSSGLFIPDERSCTCSD